MHRNAGNGEPVALGKWQQLALALGGVLGSGWIIGIPEVAQVTGPHRYLGVLPWLVGFAVLVLVAAIVVRLARTDPRSGGLAWWAQDRSGRVVGTIINAGLFVVYAGNPPAGALAAATALNDAFGWRWCTSEDGTCEVADWRIGLLALGLLSALFAVHVLGARAMLRLNVVLSAAKVLLLLVFIGVSAFAHVLILPNPGQDGDAVFAVLTVTATTGIIFAFTGFQGPVDNGDKSGKDHRGFAVYGALIISLLLYAGLQLVFAEGLAGNWHLPDPGSGWPFALRVVATVLPPLTNALVFLYLAAIVLKTSAEQGVLALPGFNKRKSFQPMLVIFAFGFGLLVLMWAGISEITAAKSVLYLFVYSYAAVCYRASWRQNVLEHSRLDTRGGRALAPVSFAAVTVIAFYTGFPTLLWACALMVVVATLMFWSRRAEADRNRAQHLRRARWLLGYFAVLLVLSGCHFVVRYSLAADPGPLADLLRGSRDLPPFENGLVDGIVTSVLAVVAVVAGLLFYRSGVREAESFIRLKNGTSG
ncbi:amino acid permease [Saccharopolyspora gloriosae]|uniref:Amino acid transporter n=1 Tax=Saccharopolyspora gloriosae TaxID=455344 RepID=A0A840NK31_9PSEU|nr:amino acid transporter [Saccharopolyspora gloriosae]